MTWSEWSGRYYLVNSGTGHHTAAIYRQCLDQQREFIFQATLKTERLDRSVIRRLKPFRLILCEENAALQIFDWSHKLDEDNPWMCFEFPYGLSDWYNPRLKIIALPRDSRLSPYVMSWLERTANSFFDFSSILDSYRGEEKPDLSACV